MLRRCFRKAEEAFKFLKTDPSLYQLVILSLSSLAVLWTFYFFKTQKAHWGFPGSAMWWLVAVIVGSFVVTQLLLTWLQRLRVERIQKKSFELCGEADTSEETDQKRIPLTLITGFLGSGKTTLVNRMLSGEHGLRAVVIENELGSISIDHALIDQQRQAYSVARSSCRSVESMCIPDGGESYRTLHHHAGTHAGRNLRPQKRLHVLLWGEPWLRVGARA